MLRLYILRDGVPVLEPDVHTWGDWMACADRHAGLDRVGDVVVSTVFIGVDPMDFLREGAPHLWECMTFAAVHEPGGRGAALTCERCPGTIDDARAMHASVLARVRAGEILPWDA